MSEIRRVCEPPETVPSQLSQILIADFFHLIDITLSVHGESEFEADRFLVSIHPINVETTVGILSRTEAIGRLHHARKWNATGDIRRPEKSIAAELRQPASSWPTITNSRDTDASIIFGSTWRFLICVSIRRQIWLKIRIHIINFSNYAKQKLSLYDNSKTAVLPMCLPCRQTLWVRSIFHIEKH